VPDTLISKADLAEWLGISPRTVDEWVRNREVPFVRVGRLVRFEPDEIRKWIAARRQPTH
jgi:excisionase family DNA binding protein